MVDEKGNENGICQVLAEPQGNIQVLFGFVSHTGDLEVVEIVVAVPKMFDVHREVSPIRVNSHNHRPGNGYYECQDANDQVEYLSAFALEVSELKHAGPHGCQELIAPYLVEVRDWSLRDAATETEEFALRLLASSHYPIENGEDDEPADVDSVDDENGVKRTQEVDIYVVLLEDVIRREGESSEQAVLDAADV